LLKAEIEFQIFITEEQRYRGTEVCHKDHDRDFS
jgi:hypothetical protein